MAFKRTVGAAALLRDVEHTDGGDSLSNGLEYISHLLFLLCRHIRFYDSIIIKPVLPNLHFRLNHQERKGTAEISDFLF